MPRFLDSYYDQLEPSPVLSSLKTRGFPVGAMIDPEQQRVVDLMSALPPFLRTLLITDGTVTRSLEAYFWEPVCVEHLALQVEENLPRLSCLETENHERLLIREVQLIGEQSKRVYARAHSVVRLSRFPAKVQDKLESGGIGIGVLINTFSLESYREILELGFCKDLQFVEKTGRHPTATPYIFRTYRIKTNGEPAILITEKFPLALYQG